VRETGLQAKVKELVLSYKDSKRWAELDVLYQLSRVLIEDPYIADNIETRYQLNGKSCLRRVKKDLRARGIEDISRSSGVLGYFFSTRCSADFESMLETRIRSLEPKFRHVVNELSLYKEGTLLAPKWTLRACSWSIDTEEQETERKLIEIGMVNRYYFSSNAFSHLAWDTPDYVQLLLHRIRQSPESYNATKFDIAKIRGLAEDPSVRSLIDWILEKGCEAGLNLFVEEGEFEKELQERGEELKKVIAKIVGSGAMTLTYSPERKRVGKRSSRPADCIFNISLELLEALSETK